MTDVTIYDVAARAGVSIATVSRVLNSPGQVQETTRGRVLAAIDALGFVPRAEATARARRHVGRIGVLAPFFTYPSFVQRLRGVAAALAGSPYELVIYNIDSIDRRDAYIASLPLTRRLDGLIVMSLSLPINDTSLQRLISHALETVLIEYHHPAFSCIEIDDEAGGRMAAEYFVAQGHRRLGFVGDSEVPSFSIHTSERRLWGYRTALRELGVPLRESAIGLAPHGLEEARQQAHKLLARPEPPTAIFAASDTQAMGVLKAAHERGLRVPEDLAIVGFDDLDIADYIGLSTIRQELDYSGKLAVEFLMRRINQRSDVPHAVDLPLTFVRRATA